MLNSEADLNDDPGSFGGSTNARKCTDILGLIIMVIIFGAAIGLTMHCMDNSEVEILTNGYDNCGNICGKDNIETDSITFDCFGKNNEKFQYLLIPDTVSLYNNETKRFKIFKPTKTYKTCNRTCKAKSVGHYCVSYRKRNRIPFYVQLQELYWWILIIVWFASIFYGAGMYYIIYHADKAEMKQNNRPGIIITTCITILIILLAYVFIWMRKYVTKEYVTVTSILVIIPAIVVILMMPSLNANFKKGDITYQLYQEVAGTTESIDSIWILPILFSIIFTAYAYGMTHCLLYVDSFSYPEKVDEVKPEFPIIEYIPYPIAKMTQALLIYTIFFLYEFMKNFQTLMISGCVAQSYFTKQGDEESEHKITPLLKHLGTVCCASAILSATLPIRVVLNALKGFVILIYKNGLYSCSRPLIIGTLFLTRNGLIMTAIHGSSVGAGTIRARKLIHNNGFNAAAISTFGDFTSLILKLRFWLLAMIICYVNSNTFNYESFKAELVYLVCCGILVALLLDYFASAFEITLNTMFLCFCEDCLYNNGESKPYFMSANFAEFVEKANKFVDEKKWNTVADSWKGGPGRLY